MNEQFIRDVWLPALRSGEYKQGHSRLRTSGNEADRYCCLGVATDLAIKNCMVGGNWRRMSEGYVSSHEYLNDGVPDYEGEVAVLPEDVSKAMGVNRWGQFSAPLSEETLQRSVIDRLSDTLQEMLSFWDSNFDSLTALNDRGATFEDIAIIVEAVLDGDAPSFTPIQEMAHA